MYEALVVLTILGVIVFFAWQRMKEMTRMTRLTKAASESPYICHSTPSGEDTHCVHWWDNEPCCWCDDKTPWGLT